MNDTLQDRYIALLRDALTATLWEGGDGALWRGRRSTRMLARLAAHRGIDLVRRADADARAVGADWPRLAHTMIGQTRMRNLQHCVETALREEVPGDLVETGVWRGGACIFMRGILAAYGVTDRTVWVADSFAGLPEPDARHFPADAGDEHHKQAELAVSLESVKANFRRYGLLDDQVRFLPGWFADTLPMASIDKLAVARLDGDMYASTMDALTALHPRISPGGFCIVDDYGAVPGCRQAVDEYRDRVGIVSPIERIDDAGAYWRV